MDVFPKAAPSVVVVMALDSRAAISQGSGVVVGRRKVVTNCHVVEDAAQITVRQAWRHVTGNTRRTKASVLVRQEERDLCLLFVEHLSGAPVGSLARLGSTRELSVGEEIYAVGAPKGLELSLSRGIVSQLRHIFGHRNAPLIQTDAAISPGSSGGGLFDGEGSLVGITTFKWRGENLNFALPVEWVQELLVSACPDMPDFDCIIALALNAAADLAYNSRVKALINVAAAQAKAGDRLAARQTLASALETAHGIGDLIDDFYSRASALAEIAVAQSKIGDGKAARETVAAALRAARRVCQGLMPLESFEEVAVALAEIGQTDAALDVALDIQKISDRVGTLITVADKQAARGDRSAARQTLTTALTAVYRIEALQTERNSVPLDYETEQMLRQAVCDPYISAEKKEKISAILDKHDQQQAIDDDAPANMLGRIAVVQAKAGDMTAAKKTVASIPKPAGRVASLVQIADAQTVMGDSPAVQQTLSGALRELQDVKDVPLHVGLLTVIAGKLAEAGNREESSRTFASALKAASGIRDAAAKGIGVFGDVRAMVLQQMAIAEANAGEIAAALEAVQGIDGSRKRTWALIAIAIAQAEAGSREAAEKTFATALRSARKISDASMRYFALKDIAVAQAESGDIGAAVRTTDVIGDDFQRTLTLQTIAVGQAEAGHVASASTLLQRIRDNRGAQNSVLIAISVAQAKAGNFRGAIRTAMKMSPYPVSHVAALTQVAVQGLAVP